MKTSALLKALLVSSSPVNVIKYSTDTKERKRARAEIASRFLITILLSFMAFFLGISFGYAGLEKDIPLFSLGITVIITFTLTFFSSAGIILSGGDTGILLSLPFSTGQIVFSRFMLMYLRSLPETLIPNLFFILSFGLYLRPVFSVYLIWVLLELFVPLVPSALSSLLSFFTSGLASFRKNKAIARTLLTVILIVSATGFRFVTDYLFTSGRMKQAAAGLSDFTRGFSAFYFPSIWFSHAVNEGNILYAFLFAVFSAFLYILAVFLISLCFKSFYCAFDSSFLSKDIRKAKARRRSLSSSISYKEWKHFRVPLKTL